MKTNAVRPARGRQSRAKKQAARPVVSRNKTVLVVGGGVSAILSLRELVKAGFDTRAVVGSEVGGEQTLACQRYLHAGSFYTNLELISLLLRARAPWRTLAEETGLRIVTGRSYVGFVDEAEAAERVAVWHITGLRYRKLRVPASHPFRTGNLRHLYLMTDEGWLADPNPAQVLSTGLEQRILRANVTRVEAYDGGFRVYAGNERRAEILSAEGLVLAAGAGNQVMIDQLSSDGRPRQQVRRCQVLELAGPLPFASLLCPSSGHFIVPAGTTGERTTWKCTFGADPAVDSADSPIDPVRYRRQQAALAAALPFTAGPMVTSTVTSVSKAESWDLGRGKRPDSYFVGEVVPGAIAIWPTKLTLAPLAAEQAVTSICRHLCP